MIDKEGIEQKLRESCRLFEQKKYGAVIRLSREILKEYPECAAAFNNIGSVFLITGKVDKAEKYLRKALELDPYMREAEDNLFKVLVYRRKLKDRSFGKELKDALERYRTMAIEGDIQGAVDGFLRLLTVEPTNVRAYNNLGIIFFKQGEYKKAEDYFMRGLELYFLQGLTFDRDYEIIRDNLKKLRAVAGSALSEVLQETLIKEIEKRLIPGEKIMYSICGIVKKIHAAPSEEASGLLAASTRRLFLVISKDSGAIVDSIPYSKLTSVAVRPGVRQSSLVIEFDGHGRVISSVAREELHLMKRTLQEIMDKILDGKLGKMEDIQTKVAMNLMTALKDMKLLSPEEYDRKKADLISQKKQE
jgi:Tfp pilus assembly protein PilF